MIDTYGSWKIIGLTVRRDPIPSTLNKVINFVSLGTWNKMRSKYNYDDLFHLSLNLILQDPNTGAKDTILLEKNQVINIAKPDSPTQSTQTIPVNVPAPLVTFSEFLSKGEGSLTDYYKYDAFKNNCQDYVLGMLRANGVLTKPAEEFIKQDMDKLVQGMPSYVAPLVRGVTDLGGVFDRVRQGGAKPHQKFQKQLEKIGYEPSAYLAEAKRRAKHFGYPEEMLGFADDGVHKLAIADGHGKVRRFGRVGYEDSLISHHKESQGKSPKGTTSAKRQRFHKSHTKIKGDWKSDPFSPNNLALHILW
jgi:hypothetical protein